jgi:hypothetical protein
MLQYAVSDPQREGDARDARDGPPRPKNPLRPARRELPPALFRG